MATAQACDKKMVQLSNCPCGLPAAYTACCERYVGGAEHLRAPTAEALMRSRYCAYTARAAPYLVATWHASTRPRRVTFPAGLRWLGLTVVRHEQADAELAIVEFLAHHENRRPDFGKRRAATPMPSDIQIMHEVSRFVRTADRWYYLDGVVS